MQALQGAMGEMQGQLSQMEMAEQMMNELQAQLSELDDLKQNIGQGNCQGMGQDAQDPNQIGNQGPQAGRGYGSRIGKERGAHSYKSAKEKTRATDGQIIGQMLIDGPQVRGEANADVTEAVNSAVRDAEDAVEREEVQRQYQRVVQNYFERLAGLMSGQTQPRSSTSKDGPEAEEQKAEKEEGSENP